MNSCFSSKKSYSWSLKLFWLSKIQKYNNIDISQYTYFIMIMKIFISNVNKSISINKKTKN